MVAIRRIMSGEGRLQNERGTGRQTRKFSGHGKEAARRYSSIGFRRVPSDNVACLNATGGMAEKSDRNVGDKKEDEADHEATQVLDPSLNVAFRRLIRSLLCDLVHRFT